MCALSNGGALNAETINETAIDNSPLLARISNTPMKPDKYEKARQKARTRQALIAAFVVPLTIFLFLHSSFVLNAEPGEHTLVRGSKQECPTVQCATTKGNFSVELQPHLAPNGTAFFKKLVKGRYFDQHIPFFVRNISNDVERRAVLTPRF